MNRRQMIIDYITRHNAERGYSPSVREIGKAVGLASPSAVHRHLERLEDDGMIKRLAIRHIEVKGQSNDKVKVEKWHKDIPSVIVWQGRRYVYDPAR